MRKVFITKSAGKHLGTKTIRVPRKRKKQLKQRWQHLWTDFIKIKLTDKLKSFCNRVNNFENNRCINCGAKAGHKCELTDKLKNEIL